MPEIKLTKDIIDQAEFEMTELNALLDKLIINSVQKLDLTDTMKMARMIIEVTNHGAPNKMYTLCALSTMLQISVKCFINEFPELRKKMGVE